MTSLEDDGYGLGILRGHLLREKLFLMKMECLLCDVMMERYVLPCARTDRDLTS